MEERWTSRSVEETFAFGERLAHRVHCGGVVALHGELGSGKTHLVKGMCRGLGFSGIVSSPTFTLINEYGGNPSIIHIDLYRLESAAQVQPLGLDELMRPDTIVMIEWPEVAASILPPSTIHVWCGHGESDDERTITVAFPE